MNQFWLLSEHILVSDKKTINLWFVVGVYGRRLITQGEGCSHGRRHCACLSKLFNGNSSSQRMCQSYKIESQPSLAMSLALRHKYSVSRLGRLYLDCPVCSWWLQLHPAFTHPWSQTYLQLILNLYMNFSYLAFDLAKGKKGSTEAEQYIRKVVSLWTNQSIKVPIVQGQHAGQTDTVQSNS